MEIEIKKVKLDAQNRPLIIYYKLVDGKKSGRLVMDEAPVAHDDLVNAIAKLAPHYSIMSGYVAATKIKDIDKFAEPVVETFHPNGFSIGGKDEDQGIVITGNHDMEGTSPINLNTPFRRFNQDEGRYKFMDQLILLVTYAKEEAKLYIDGKIKKDPQLELQMPAGGVDQEETLK